ncbi:MAG TPA: tRNA (adenosine(37)-N6)-threonylcarbamoyltransferase complex ATPase subunit type 1 TsaE [Flavobacteriales bacterium]
MQVQHIEELKEVAQRFIQHYPEGGVFELRGHMGAGKTTLVKAICNELGLKQTSSPTFALVNVYKNDKHTVYHFDLYRLKSLEEALDFGFDEYLDEAGYIFIEWPDVVEDILPEDTSLITIEEENGKRTIVF